MTAKYRPHYKWSAAALALLGTMSDVSLAQILGVVPACVSTRRRQRHVDAFNPHGGIPPKVLSADELAALRPAPGQVQASNPGTQLQQTVLDRLPRSCRLASDEFIKSLGKALDKDLAARFHLSEGQVARARKKLGIPSSRGNCILRPEQIKLLGTKSDMQLATDFGVPISAITKARQRLGIPGIRQHAPIPKEAIELLGKVTDVELAKRFGGHPIRFLLRRSRDGIPCATRPKRRMPKGFYSKLGIVPDADIAQKFDVPVKQVRLIRYELGIEQYRRSGQRTTGSSSRALHNAGLPG